jgi:deoxyribonuclease-4
MLILGAHMSAAGGAHKAVARAAEVSATCVQIFLNPPQAWPRAIGTTKKSRQPFLDEWEPQGTDFQESLQQHGISHPIAHSSYLINLASPDKALWKKSVDAYVAELYRAEALGIPYVVLHPGAYTHSSESEGLKQVVRGLNEVHKQTRGISAQCLLENTAGQGTCLGCTFEQLAHMMDRVRDPDCLGICFDTCHAFAAGYELATLKGFRQTMRSLEQTVGLDRVKAFHLNDSKRELGARVDRHEHIGKGHIGIQAFARVVNDRRFRKVPMYLETPKGHHPRSDKAWDVVNLRRLRNLVGKPID